MAKKKQQSSGPVAGVYDTDTGTCELVRDTLTADGWTILVNGVPSSHIDIDDPTQLDFEYMRWMAGLVRHHPFASDKLRPLLRSRVPRRAAGGRRTRRQAGRTRSRMVRSTARAAAAYPRR